MKKQHSGKIAFLGIMTALALVCLLITAQPIATVGMAALAAICGIPVVVEWGRKAGILHFVTVSLLALWLIPAWEGKMLYVCFLGYYTIFKAWLEHFSLPKWSEYLIKIGFFLIALPAWGILSLAILGTPLPQWFSPWMLPVAVVLLIGLFLLYDWCLTGLATAYMRRLHPLVARLFRFS